MTDSKRITTIRRIDTRVTFTNDELRAILAAAAGVPPHNPTTDLVNTDSYSYYDDLTVTWTVIETQESDE